MASQGFLTQWDFVTMNNLRNEKVELYSLIDWKNQKTLKENVSLTPSESHDLNYALALNNVGKRYVKEYNTEDNSIEKHIYSDNIRHINTINNK